MATKTVGELIDLAVDKLPRWQAGFVRLTLRVRPRKRQQVVEGVGFNLAHNAEFQGLCSNASVFTGDSFGEDTPIEFDPDNLERILQIILEYLPQILQLFLMFGSILFPMMFAALLSSPAIAQDCPDLAPAKIVSVEVAIAPAQSVEPLVAAIRDAWTSTVYAEMARGQEHLVYHHLVSEHGYTKSQVDQIKRLAPSVRLKYALMCHNLAHGPRRNSLIGGREPGQVRLQIATPAANGNCANGQCARPTTTTQSHGFFGRIFGR